MRVIAKYDLIYNAGTHTELVAGGHNGLKAITKGKCYEALSITYQVDGVWIEDKITHIPSDNQFFVRIKEDDNGNIHHIWNSYFMSTSEYRELIINEILKT